MNTTHLHDKTPSKQIWGYVITGQYFIKKKIYLTLQLNLLAHSQSTWRGQLHEACSKSQLEWIFSLVFSVLCLGHESSNYEVTSKLPEGYWNKQQECEDGMENTMDVSMAKPMEPKVSMQKPWSYKFNFLMLVAGNIKIPGKYLTRYFYSFFTILLKFIWTVYAFYSAV